MRVLTESQRKRATMNWWYGVCKVPSNDNWRGFLSESKSYMNYDGQSRRGKVRFWRQFPRAWFVWHYLTWFDK